MTDWATVSALATAGGTLVLAAATFASVRSTHQAARATERALLAGIRPVLVPSRLEDPPEKVGFGDNHWLKVGGGLAGAEVVDDVVYLAIPLRNVGNGIGVLDRWDFAAGHENGTYPHREPEQFYRLTRDLYVPATDRGFWQGAFRDPSDPMYEIAKTAVSERQRVGIDVLYGDHEGGQRTITRIMLTPLEDSRWIAAVVRHWNLDRADPR
ncbi:MAG: hypothetical protein M3Z46_08910 [Actinomycetota bacterium]|nr:hypothetical protein [Actinomycetota bacterium]